MKRRHEQKLVIVTISLLALLNIPIITLFKSTESIVGFPVIYIYIFSCWLASIIISYIIINHFYE
ncbi:hypothetical protein [Flavobacterium kingsejongi]|uniref:DUF3311 domain-containing protein n=1 Tax=Flavobacterium kingsejongi TaxID=1678728 RepID=A0A2S1LRK3_9FLAO|nr:hypothetical protein [Flavobacterium kingsejongi]AWG26397.1 hypothetical protein FK004_14760 [Flavobacterium kingsejongi]